MPLPSASFLNRSLRMAKAERGQRSAAASRPWVSRMRGDDAVPATVVAVWHRVPQPVGSGGALTTSAAGDAAGYWEGALGVLEHGKFDS